MNEVLAVILVFGVFSATLSMGPAILYKWLDFKFGPGSGDRYKEARKSETEKTEFFYMVLF